jgi:PAS domain S-box-containing protein
VELAAVRWSPAMLEQLNDQIRECHENAADARAKANAAADPVLKAEFLATENRWLTLARSLGFSERLEVFTTENSKQRKKFDQYTQAKIESAPDGFLPGGVEQVLKSIVENSDDAIVTKNLDGIISSWNKSAERIFGYTAEEAVGKPVTILIPPERHNEESGILVRLRRGERIDHYETVRRRKDGTLIDISLTVSPVKDAHGKIVGAAKIARDITDRKRNDEHIATLAREAEHRTKNILATVQATVNLSRSDTPEGLKRAIEGRIQALAKLHDLFVDSHWTGAALASIASQELAPYAGGNERRVQIDGPSVWLAPNTAQAIGVTLHELVTNAAKYGSLSVSGGRVGISWLRAPDERLILRWSESGGPVVKKPTLQGFGTSVIQQMIRRQLKGEMHLDWRPEGLECEIVFTP